MKRIFLLSFFFVCVSFCASAQQDTEFWLAIPEVSRTGASDLDRPVFIRMTAFATAATVTISQPAGGGMPATVLAIPAYSTVSLDMTPWIDVIENKPANTVLNYGIHISSTAPISAYYHVVSGACLCNPEDFVLKGKNALGTDFWIPGQNVLDNSLSYTPTPYSSFDIVATQNATTVTITPSRNIVGHVAGVPFTILLNRGQSYSATATSTLAANHLVGSRVTADKPIAITEKDDLLYMLSLGIGGADLIGDQIVPTNVLGTEYIPMYGDLTTPGDQLFITATAPGTNVMVNGVLVTTIAAAGGTYQMTAPSPSCYIQTNFPVYIYQLSGIHSEVGSALLPQINCTGSFSVSIQQSASIDFKLNLLVKTVGTGGFLVNGVAGVITPGMFSPVPATGGVWSMAQVTLPVSTYPTGSVLTVSNPSDLFQMGYLSSGPPGSGASFGYFSNYGGINPNPTTTTPNICTGDSIKLFSNFFADGSYLWTGPGGFTSTLEDPFTAGASILDSGEYKVIVRTPVCEDSGRVTVAVHPYPSVDLGNDTLLCGSGPLTLLNHVPGYASNTHLWSTTATTPTISVAASGSYWLAVTNAVCTTSDTIDVNIVPLTGPVVTPVTFCQYDTATPLTAVGTGLLWYTTATGGTGSPVAPTPSTTVPGIAAYYVTATTGPCESARVPLNVTIIPLPAPPAISGINTYCHGQPFVPLSVVGFGILWYDSLTGGTGSFGAPYINTYMPGKYTFYASQTVSGCEGPRQAVSITVLDSITPYFNYSIRYGCKGDTLLFTNLSAGAANYLWDFGDLENDTAANPRHIYKTQDSFTIRLLAINGHCIDSISKKVQLIHPLNAAFTFTPEILCQDSLVTFTNASIGTGLSYKWLFGNGAVSTVTNVDYTYKKAGIYKVQLISTDFVPCHDTAEGIVQVDSLSAISIRVSDTVICRGAYTTLTGDYTSIGNTGVTWNFGNDDSIANENPVKQGFDGTGRYTIRATAHFRACKDVSASRSVVVLQAPNLYLGPDTTICPGGVALSLGDYANANAPGMSWRWSTGQSTSGITVVSPGIYYATAYLNGCMATDTIVVANDCYVNIPNVFSPNGDGMNDYFFPRQYLSRGLTQFKMEIYNRWGQLLFETTNLQGAGWDGKYNNMEQPVGVYVYLIDATFKDGQKEKHRGNVTLLR